MEKDLNMAREVQLAFIAKQPSHFPENTPVEKSSMQFFHCYLPASTLAGDFFNILPISEHKVGVLICDVMGHGTRASLLTAYFQGLIEELMPIADDSGVFLKKLNLSLNAIMSQFYTGVFATIFYLVIDLRNNKISYTNAGHPAPFILHRTEGVVKDIQPNIKEVEPALGLFKDYNYTIYEYPINKDDVLFLFTDGLYEVKNVHNKIYGRQKLFESLGKHIFMHPEKLFNPILDEIYTFGQSKELKDDVCLVAAHIK